MRDQYAGDLSALIKLSFLRALAADTRKLGVAWYYAPGDDGRPDGRHVEHRAEEIWRALDPEVHGALADLAERRVAALEGLPIWPAGTTFHREPVAKTKRKEWLAGMQSALEAASLVFVDPDNGLGTHWEKHTPLSDLLALHRPGRAQLVIKFPGRTNTHEAQVQALHAQLQRAGFTGVFTLKTSVSVRSESGSNRLPRARFFTLPARTTC